MTSTSFKLDDITPDISISSGGLSNGSFPDVVSLQRRRPTSLMVQKYFPASSRGEAQVSRSSSRVSRRSHTSSQLQCSGFPPKLNTSDVSGEPFSLAYTGMRRNNGSGGIFFSLLDVMSSLGMEAETRGGGGRGQTRTQLGDMKRTGDGKLLASALSSEERERMLEKIPSGTFSMRLWSRLRVLTLTSMAMVSQGMFTRLL
ncbi:hypothetical protein EYF80_040148 [Liparis tanakae]|uniref:Uncharacterized protein n=1 Tax=Liparis tanakae TaxID=230148 RepID=A0A4Z2G8P4_9TELE|nr:hypothetical protein EYF80_040148 [Liparis tanakae]